MPRKSRPTPPPRKSVLRALRTGVLAFVMAWLIVTIAVIALLRFIPPPTSAFMIAAKVEALREGTPLTIRYDWTPWSAMSKWAPLAMVAGEDQHFPFHHGFDFAAIQKAITASEDGARLRGASTISQQTAKNLFLWSGRSWVRKGLEAYFTVLLETLWPKQRILEVYANIAQLGPGIYGVGAASRIFFHTDAARLNPFDASLLAAALPNPIARRVNAPSPTLLSRAAWIRRQMQQLGGTDYVNFDGDAKH